ncbi:MAG: twin-arginine translocase TatA/TatE family subunit [Trueperaceae bacterium]|nr:twin-arginine translocase TatA/TatE family subunit [Trueperaceae bacterium]
MRIGPFGIWEILIILVIVLLVFGPRRLPEMAKGLGQSVRVFRKELRDMKSDLDFDDKPETPQASASRPPVASGPAATPAAEPRPAAEPEPAPEASKPREGGDAAA